MLKAKQSFNGQQTRDVYATGLDYQEMIVLWFLVLRTKVVLYEMSKYKEDVVDVSESLSKCQRRWSYYLMLLLS